MGHQRGIVAYVPRLGEIGLHLQELGIGYLVELLVLLVPLLAEGQHTGGNQVTGLRDGGFPGYRIAIAGGTGVSVGETHLGHELVFHHVADIEQRILQPGELIGNPVLELVLQDDGTELEPAGRRTLPLIGPFARDGVHIEIAGTIDHVVADAGKRGGRGEEPATTAGSVTADAVPVAAHEGGYQTGEFHGGLESVLIVVVVAAVELPSVGAMESYVKLLTTAEGVALGKTDHQLGAHSAHAAARGTRLDVEVVGFVEHTVELKVEGVAGGRGVTGCELEIHHAVDAHGVDLLDGFKMVLVIVETVRAKPQVGQDDSRTDGRALAVEANGEAAVVGHGIYPVHDPLTEFHIDLSDIPAMPGLLGNVVDHLETQLGLAGNGQGISQIVAVGRLEIVVAVGTEQIGDAVALAAQGGHVEGVSLVDVS